MTVDCCTRVWAGAERFATPPTTPPGNSRLRSEGGGRGRGATSATAARPPASSAPLVIDEPDTATVESAAETVSAREDQVRTQTVRQKTRVESGSEHEIDNQLAHLTKRTSLEELTRAGKTHNLKTLSERNLKEWIKEALRRVISNSTTIGAAEQEQLLANTRSELTAIMAERQAEADERVAAFVNEGHEQTNRVHQHPGQRQIRKRDGQHRSAEQKPQRVSMMMTMLRCSVWHGSENAVS